MLVQVFPVPEWVQFGAGVELQEGVWIPHPAAVLVRATDLCAPSPGQWGIRLWWDVGLLSPVLHQMEPELQFWPARPSSGNIIWRARLWRLLPRRWQLTPPPPLKKTAAWRWWVISNWFKGAKKRETWKTFELRDAFWATGVLQLPKHLEDASAGPSKDFLSMLLVICSGGIRHDSDGGQKMFWGSRSEAQWCWRGGAARLLLSKWADHLRGSGAVCKG